MPERIAEGPSRTSPTVPFTLDRTRCRPPTLRLRSDEHLVSLFRAGREEAFDVLHERHRRRLHAAASRALRSSGGDAEGVVQEAFLRAHRHAARRPPADRAQAVAAPRRAQPLHRRAAPQPAADDGARGRRPRRRGRGRLQHAEPPPRAAAADRGPRRPARAAARGAAHARARRAQPRGGRERAGRLARRLAPARQARPQRAGRRRRGARRRVRRDPRRPAARARREAPAVRARAAPPQDLLGLPRVPRRA